MYGYYTLVYCSRSRLVYDPDRCLNLLLILTERYFSALDYHGIAVSCFEKELWGIQLPLVNKCIGFLISSFLCVLYVVCFLLSNYPASGV